MPNKLHVRRQSHFPAFYKPKCTFYNIASGANTFSVQKALVFEAIQETLYFALC